LEFLGFAVGLNLGVFMSIILVLANWGLHGQITPKLVSVLLSFFLSGTAVHCLVATILLVRQEEAEDGVLEEEEKMSSA
jgi:uncharacterized protein YacL